MTKPECPRPPVVAWSAILRPRASDCQENPDGRNHCERHEHSQTIASIDCADHAHLAGGTLLLTLTACPRHTGYTGDPLRDEWARPGCKGSSSRTARHLRSVRGSAMRQTELYAASLVHLAHERLPAHCWCHSPGHRDPCMGSRGAGDVARRNRVHPCRSLRRRCRHACVANPRMVASLITWSPLTCSLA